MLIYHYDKATGEYLGSTQAKESPREPGVYRIPAYATDKAPPTAGENEAPVFSVELDGWALVPNWRGTVYWLPSDGDSDDPDVVDGREITELGVEPPVDAVYSLPPKSPALVGAEKVSELSGACEADIVSGFTSSALGTECTYQSDRDDQLNLIGAVSSGVDMTFKCKDSSGVWDYRTHTAAQLQQVMSDGASVKHTKLNRFNQLRADVNAILDDAALTDDEKRTQIEAIVW